MIQCKKKPDVSIIIVNYKTARLVEESIRSVIEKTQRVSYEAIVVDNHSEDNIEEVIHKIKEERNIAITIIKLGDNIGFGKANNEGIAIARGRNILFLNPDTKILNDAISLLSDYLDSNENVGAVGGNLYDEQMQPALSFRRIYPGIRWELCEMTAHRVENIIYRGSWRFNNTSRPLSVSYISGADLMIRRSVIDEVGCFAREFFMYYEETDLCHRVRKSGYNIVSLPDAKIQHLEGKSVEGKNKRIGKRGLSFAEKGRRIYYMKNVGRGRRIVAQWIYAFSLRALYFVSKIIGSASAEDFKMRIEIVDELDNEHLS